MRTVTKAEAERDLSTVLDAAAKEPVRIREGDRDVVVVSAAEFEEAQALLKKERVRVFHEARIRISKEARASGFTEDMLPGLLEDE
jgi:prevent-host-death family protein